ncbi:MAG: transposase [Methylovulum sp.]|nr:transposase [Methylovulum sp.]
MSIPFNRCTVPPFQPPSFKYHRSGYGKSHRTPTGHKWQSESPDGVCPIIHLDCLAVKIRQDKRVTNKAVYVAQGLNMQGHKELLGALAVRAGRAYTLSGAQEGWGIKAVFVACVDGLAGFPECHRRGSSPKRRFSPVSSTW